MFSWAVGNVGENILAERDMPFFRRHYPSRRSVAHYKHFYPANYYVDAYDRDYYLLPALHAMRAAPTSLEPVTPPLVAGESS